MAHPGSSCSSAVGHSVGRQAAADSLQESDGLDWKGVLPQASGDGRCIELARDVAAVANTRGGLLRAARAGARGMCVGVLLARFGLRQCRPATRRSRAGDGVRPDVWVLPRPLAAAWNSCLAVGLEPAFGCTPGPEPPFFTGAAPDMCGLGVRRSPSGAWSFVFAWWERDRFTVEAVDGCPVFAS